MKKPIILILYILLFSIKVKANDVVMISNAYFNLVHLNNGIYELKLHVETDRGLIDYSTSKTKVGFYNKSNNKLVKELVLKYNRSRELEYSLKCIKNQNYLLKLEYTTQINIDSLFYENNYSKDGYYFYWEKCCLPNTMTNAYLPSEQSVAAYLEIPSFFSSRNYSDRFINSSPTLSTNYNSSFCVGIEAEISVSSEDLDGDSLVYKLVDPLSGTHTSNVYSGSAYGAKPYYTLTWNTNYSSTNFIDSKTNIEFDSKNGIIKFLPKKIGGYTTGLSVEEYRNGKLISSSIRNIYFNIFKCPVLFTEPLKNPISSVGDTATFKVFITEKNAVFQWQKKSGDKYINLENEKADSLKLFISEKNIEENEYRCWVIANSCGIFSNDARVTVVEKTGIDKSNTSRKITLSPNPSHDYVDVLGLNQIESIRLYCLNGKLLKEVNNTSRIDVSDIQAGLYFISVLDKEQKGYYFEKLIIGE